MIGNKKLGLIPFVVARSKEYWMIFQGVLIAYYTLGIDRFTGVVLSEIGLLGVFLLGVGGVLVLVFDWFVMFPSHMEVHTSRVPWFVRAEEKLDELLARVKPTPEDLGGHAGK